MTWPQGAIDPPTITGRPWLAPDSIQPLFACDHCTFSRVGDAAFFLERNDARLIFFFDFDGIKNLFDIRGKRNFTEPHLSGKSPWTGVDSNTEANVFSTVVELPTSELAPKPEL